MSDDEITREEMAARWFAVLFDTSIQTGQMCVPSQIGLRCSLLQNEVDGISAMPQVRSTSTCDHCQSHLQFRTWEKGPANDIETKDVFVYCASCERDVGWSFKSLTEARNVASLRHFIVDVFSSPEARAGRAFGRILKAGAP